MRPRFSCTRGSWPFLQLSAEHAAATMASSNHLAKLWAGGRRSLTADAALAGVVVAVVGLMVVPLPTWLLDLLLACNLAGSVSILLVTLYVTSALQIAAFPTLLLLTTL